VACVGGPLLADPARSAEPTVSLPAPDPTSIWTLADENSSISGSGLTDRYYTNGLRLGFTSGTSSDPDALQRLGDLVFGPGRQRLTVDLTQQIFTPRDTEAYDPPPGDRPYAGLLLANVGILQDTPGSRAVLNLGVGIVGPSALGESVQNGFHAIIGQGDNNGWSTQLHDQPVFEALGGRVWRVPTGQLGGLATDILPDVSVGVGLVRVYAEAGAQIRLGRGLDSDFGVARMRPGPSGADAFQPTRPFAWYVFAGADGQAVAYDVTLDGNLWHDSRSVTLKPLVGELQTGAALIAWGTRLSYTQVFQTEEFQHQKGGLHQFGSLALSVRF
jgi:hypothetical protein